MMRWVAVLCSVLARLVLKGLRAGLGSDRLKMLRAWLGERMRSADGLKILGSGVMRGVPRGESIGSAGLGSARA